MKPAVLAEIMQEQEECECFTQARLQNMADRQALGKQVYCKDICWSNLSSTVAEYETQAFA